MEQQPTWDDVYDVDPSSGALILGANRLDDYAAKFLTKYCKEALTTPMPLPVDQMLEKANLRVKTARLSNNLDVFGCCLLLDGYVQVYDAEKGDYVPAFYEAGTLVFDPQSEWDYGEGCKRNTLIHEMIHWEKDKRYFEILELKNRKAKERLYPIMCCQSRVNYMPPKGKKTKLNQVQWLEWQAHRLAPRVLMPKEMFIRKARELMTSGIPSCDSLVDQLSDFFIVSRTSAKIRLTEVGLEESLKRFPDYQDVFHEKNRKEHIALSAAEAFEMLSEDVILQEWVRENHMIFVDGYFVIADPKYVVVRNGEPHLTQTARRNLAVCTLNICEQHIISKDIAGKDYNRGYAVLYNVSITDTRLLLFHPKFQEGFTGYVKEEEKKGFAGGLNGIEDEDVYDAVIHSLFVEMDETTKEFIRKLGDPFTSLCQCLWYWFVNHDLIKAEQFCKATKLHRNYFANIKNDKMNDMKRDTLMAICVGCGFDLNMTQRVFRKAHIELREFENPDMTYQRLLERFPQLGIDKFNALLSRMNLKQLGTFVSDDP